MLPVAKNWIVLGMTPRNVVVNLPTKMINAEKIVMVSFKGFTSDIYYQVILLQVYNSVASTVVYNLAL